MKLLQRFYQILSKQVDISSLVLFRVAFGGILLWEVSRYFYYDWIERYWIDPIFYFTYDGFHWLSPWGGNGMYVHFLGLGLLAFCIMIGLWYRVCTVLFFFGFTYIFLLDKANYLNHFYLISILSGLMIFLPAHRSFSLDARLQPEIQTDYIAYWPVFLLQFQLGIAYFFGGVAKINGDWLRGEPLRRWLAREDDFPLIGPLFHEEWMVYLFTYGGLLLDLLIVPFLFWKRTRTLAFLAILTFHLLNSQLWKIGIFPWFMIAATTIYFRADWFRRLWYRLRSVEWLSFPARATKFLNPASLPNWGTYAIGGFMLLQILLPLRHFLYPGNVSWTEKGHRFSWHMKLRDKAAKATFVVTDLQTQETFKVKPRDYLSRRQYRKMAARPDMILQFAHYLEEVFVRKGHAQVTVNAKVRAKLNGRAYQDLIQPEVNLLEINSQSAIHDWVAPLTTPLPKNHSKKQ